MAATEKAEKTWRFVEVRDGEAIFGCKFAECLYEHHDPGGVHLHYMKKHGSNASRVPAATATNRNEQRQSAGAKRKPQQNAGHKHAWRLLKRNNAVEAAAIHEGYEEVCESCEELR